MRRRFALLAVVLAVLVLAAPAQAAEKDCRDFPSQGKAQEYFKGYGGSATNNLDGLDADHDGWACDGYPYRTATGMPTERGGATASGSGELAQTGAGDVARTAAAGLLVAGLLLVAATRYRPRHAR